MEQRFLISVLVASVLVWGYSCGTLEYAYTDDIYYNPETDNPVKVVNVSKEQKRESPMLVPDRNDEVIYINKELKHISDSIKGENTDYDTYEYADRLRRFHSDDYSGTYFTDEEVEEAYNEGYYEGYRDRHWDYNWRFNYGYSGYGSYWGLGYYSGWGYPYYDSWYSYNWHYPHYYHHYSWYPWYSYPVHYPVYTVSTVQKGHRTTGGHSRGVNNTGVSPEYKAVSTYRNSIGGGSTTKSGTVNNVPEVKVPQLGRTVYTRQANANSESGRNTYKSTSVTPSTGTNSRSGYTPSYRRSSGASTTTYNRSQNYNNAPVTNQKRNNFV